MNMKNCFLALHFFLLLSFYTATHAGFCEYADTTYAKVTTSVAGAGIATGVGLKAFGVTALAHSSGAAIAATASGGYLAGTLGAVGAVTGFVTAPATLIIGGVAITTAGGAIAYCHYKNNGKPTTSMVAGSALRKTK